ncbi:MAG: hypothetical protein ACYTG4_06450 [Planctomycetota bacterium]|jgi:hypothetical protein
MVRIQSLPPEDSDPGGAAGGVSRDRGTGGFWFLVGIVFVVLGSSSRGGGTRSFVFYAVGAAFIYLAWKARVDRDAGRGPVHETLPDEVDPGDDGEDDEWEDDRDELWRSP